MIAGGGATEHEAETTLGGLKAALSKCSSPASCRSAASLINPAALPLCDAAPKRDNRLQPARLQPASPFLAKGAVTAAIVAAARISGEPASRITGQSRALHLCHLRYAVVVALRAQPAPPSFPAIGRLLGGRDHATMMHALDRGMAMLQDDHQFAALVLQISDHVEAACRLQIADRQRVAAIVARLCDQPRSGTRTIAPP